MNKYSDKLLNYFKETYRRQFNKCITDDEATTKLASLAGFVRTIAPDRPSSKPANNKKGE